MTISDEEKKLLLNIARNSILIKFSGEEISQKDLPESNILNEKLGIFVTLTKADDLRGCVGFISTDKPLYKAAADAALLAAFNDSRFNPLTREELDECQIEISVLSAPEKVKNYDEIEIGKDGLILDEIFNSALLLPQVPVKHGMGRSKFLESLCRKAGLPGDTWKTKKLRLKKFSAEVFSEAEIGF
ncbi:MAG: AmmeMemoRadiSam system protein A [Ignavibacteriales bacterium]|nr:AmmeMemoRadiSam system protein A [Ignavibacteriales bacterium]MCF8314881.1 AmmeMemoRadiSam system protein A [Ignavibacteriales bacterium]MCF8436170.1 AmmeMemoRadiSam system protein A [Ignavibacteriales bacterium]